MLKKGVSILVLLSFLSSFLYSCTGDRATTPGKSPGGCADLACLEDRLSTAPEVRELIEIRDEIASRAIARHITPEQVRDVATDAERSNDLLGLSRTEARELQGRIDAAVASLRGAYPALEDLMAQRAYECDACAVERLAATWEKYLAFTAASGSGDAGIRARAIDARGAGALGAPARPPMKCKWTQLTIGFMLCALKSGGSMLVYGICAYAVFCGSCDGGMADIMCP